MKISIYIATSANGFISNSRNVPDWLSPEYGNGFYAICQRTKAVIMGRTSYDILAPDYLPLTTEGKTIVLTTNKTLKPANPTVEFTAEEPAAIVDKLQSEGYEEAVIIGGAMTMSAFLNAGLVNDLYFVVEPVLFGSGLPLLKNVETDSKLELAEVTKLNDNTVQLHYLIK
ncbi:Dihydrofolate reductase [Chitinophaga terrae (ex Kim and Jung 2007)]|uniref:Dihydrofolate reductase n=1 Tax=Chitinophaga terrae (ex Kim and Jung 2007) TaxID=408074 RepID=A0A1H4GD98_9BACT|nr:dihydrofolate reductase family protein [Chitinophaga terrae (ex Kim and Jung 2007)]MDQ0110204.1 dihydrofolate reductase [Chitinophaga terrae (ex Kim and Jung 2007)]GEP93319.1 dihydrofolate reductase [Chitinophaga terrae (ex Kim and Jung 2007)]SEB07585.1 Dihydrofolate reductase [Chitinophaga terrae (ex Kim and Jung 2007)]